MNERIKELAIEAGVISAEYNGFDPTGLTTSQRKFAKLIVRECIELNKQELAFNAFERLLNIYKEHFGVEE